MIFHYTCKGCNFNVMCKLLHLAEFGYYIVFCMLIFLDSQTVSEISIYGINIVLVCHCAF